MAGALQGRGRRPGKLKQLVFYLERYGDEIEADFLTEYHGLNLGKLWRSRQLVRILRLINQLPQASRFNAAVAQNIEHVEQIVAATGGQQSEYSPSLATWSTENDQLASLNDSIQVLIGVLIGVNGGNAPKVIPSARPKTAFEDARMKVKKARHKSLVARVIRKRAQVD